MGMAACRVQDAAIAAAAFGGDGCIAGFPQRQAKAAAWGMQQGNKIQGLGCMALERLRQVGAVCLNQAGLYRKPDGQTDNRGE